MKKTLLASFFFVSLIGCKKKQDKSISIWTINGTEYKSNNCTIVIGNGESIITGNDPKSRWDLIFYTPLPHEGEWPIRSFRPDGNNPYFVYLAFYKDTRLYAVSLNNSNLLHAHDVNGKASFNLEPTWFIRMVNNDPGNLLPADSSLSYTSDSVLISGTFNQP